MADQTKVPASESEALTDPIVNETADASDQSSGEPPLFKPVAEIANRKGAEVRVHVVDVFGRLDNGPAHPVRKLFGHLPLDIHEELQKSKQPRSGLVAALNVSCDEQPGRPPRLLISSGPSVYVIVSATDSGELEASLYAHIPADINNLVVPKLIDRGVKISASAFVRPTSL